MKILKYERTYIIGVNSLRNLEKLTELWNGNGPNLNAGCGPAGTCIRPPFINYDIKKYESWDDKPHCTFKLGDVRDISYPDNHFDVVFASELLEHFMWGDDVKVLREFYRVLKPGGAIKIIVPDFEYAVRTYLGTNTYGSWDKRKGLMGVKDGKIHTRNDLIWSVLFGVQRHYPDGLTWKTEHHTVFDEELLTWHLERTGFKDVIRVNDKLPWSYPACNERDLAMEGWKE